VSITVAQLRFRCRRLCLPNIRFSDFYVESIGRTLDSGGVHRTLGKKYWLKGAVDAAGRRRASQAFGSVGLEPFAIIVKHGLAPHHSCVDYGCGMLRIGMHAIRFLDRGNYWGLDITDRFFRDGLELMEQDLIESKAPHLRVIEESVIAALERTPPDFLFSNAVLKHVPPFELDGFFDNFMRLVGPRTRAIIFFEEAPEQRRTAGVTWAYPADLLIGKIRSRNSSATVEIERFDWVLGRGGPNRMQSILLIDGKDRLAGPGFARPLGSLSYADHYAVRNAALDVPPAVMPPDLWRDIDSGRRRPRSLAAAAAGAAANSNEKQAVRDVGRNRRRGGRLGTIAAAVALLICAGAAAMFAIRERAAEAVISGVASAAIDLRHAIAAAAQRDGGRIVQADFELRHGVPAYVVEIENSGSLDKVVVDADTGEVLKIKALKTSSGIVDARAESAESANQPLLLAIHLAAAITKGKAISVDVAGTGIYDVDVAVGGEREQVTIDSRSEAVLSVGPDDDI